jgi:chromosome segregation ATPase
MLIKISVPTYTANSWGQLDKQGEIEVSAEVDSLSEGYTALKTQIDELLTQTNAENKIVTDIQIINSQIDRRKKILRDLDEKTERAKAQLQRLEKFLRRLGINPTDYSLEISTNPALDAATDKSEEVVAVEAEVDPIPFSQASAGSDNNPHEF